ncbi:hypothetical protein [Streptomyces sp. NPDC056682]|uniref:hypothetical protein n=1 Tax=Streptomyces sp. NPDC056682 TaxID=3345909 RepID=UPI0036A04A30
MAEIEVPGPEPEWETAPSYQGGKHNPAFQQSMWTFASSSFRSRPLEWCIDGHSVISF